MSTMMGRFSAERPLADRRADLESDGLVEGREDQRLFLFLDQSDVVRNGHVVPLSICRRTL